MTETRTKHFYVAHRLAIKVFFGQRYENKFLFFNKKGLSFLGKNCLFHENYALHLTYPSRDVLAKYDETLVFYTVQIKICYFKVKAKHITHPVLLV